MVLKKLTRVRESFQKLKKQLKLSLYEIFFILIIVQEEEKTRSVEKSLQETPSSVCLVNYPPFCPLLALFCPLFTTPVSYHLHASLFCRHPSDKLPKIRLIFTFCLWLFQLSLEKHQIAKYISCNCYNNSKIYISITSENL